MNEAVVSKFADVHERLQTNGDPARGRWLVDPHGCTTLWADASNIAYGVALEVDGDVVEDAY